MPARSVCLVALSLSEAGPGRFGRQASVTDIYHAMPCADTCITLRTQANMANVDAIQAAATTGMAASSDVNSEVWHGMVEVCEGMVRLTLPLVPWLESAVHTC